VKYAKKSVSIVFPSSIVNYGALSNGTVVRESTVKQPFLNATVIGGGTSNNEYPKINCLLGSSGISDCLARAPASNFIHFTGKRKPWFHSPPHDLSNETQYKGQNHLWYYTLNRLNDELHMGLNFSHWETGRSRRPLLGMYPKYGDIKTMNASILDEAPL
jgi:hypothetical protein